MSYLKKARILIVFLLTILVSSSVMSGCNTITQSSTTSTSASSVRFASGTKGVKILTNTTASGSYGAPTATPTPTVIPSTYPGYDGTSTYLPGISPTVYYDLDGTTGISQPSWLLDFQMGISSTSGSGQCAAFGTGLNDLDPANYYRVSERDCGLTQCNGSSCNGSGTGTDPVFFRIILDRDTSVLGSAENLMVSVEYQASGIHLNSDGSSSAAEDNLDQLWKIYWSSSLDATATPKTFGIFVPPNYSACIPGGASNTGAGGAGDACAQTTYRGAQVKVRQFIIPLSAYPTMKVIQFARVKSRITATGLDNYVSSFCATNSPLCLGIVIRSVTITRM